MKSVFLASFLTDVKKLRNAKVQRAIVAAIVHVEQANALTDVRSLKRLSGHRDYFRIRVGDWRIGLHVAGDTVTFVRCLHRREIYRFFP
ncbi:MAG: mRNA interferase RelE/StbE [Humisphaera sp.]|nr:mRNA interferase RelE/StbE [Humisphaera sp.]